MTRLLLPIYLSTYIQYTMATLSASTSYRPQQEEYYHNDIPEGSYGAQDGAQEATIEGWRDIA